MNPRLTFMLEIIKKIGDFQHAHFRTEIVFEEKKGIMDVVSFVDKESEEMFTRELSLKFSEDMIMGEESYDKNHDYSQHEKLWIIDPLDGTLMFKRGIPTYGPMIAYVENGIIQCSAIYLPEFDELYHADNNGAYRNTNNIEVSKIDKISSGLIHTPANMMRRCIWNDQKFCHMLDKIGQSADLYSCAINMSYCAAGNIDGGIFSPAHGNIWDTIPGCYLIQQAGWKVTNFWSDSWDIFNPHVIFSNGLIHEEFRKLIES
jgi:myo-inositol-1(or 4)-monophosphatase